MTNPTNTRISELVRDLTKAHPMSKSEVKARISQLLADEVSRVREDELAVALHMVAHMTRKDAHEAIKGRLSELERKESKRE